METDRPGSTERITILDIPVDKVHLDDLPAVVEDLLSRDSVNQIVFINTRGLLKARRNKEYQAFLKNAALVIPTSKGLVWGARASRKGEIYRQMPFEFVIHLLGAVEKIQGSLYIIGQKPAELQSVENNLKTSFPQLKCVGRYTGFYPREMKNDIITSIKKTAPSLLLAGRGLQNREQWIYENRTLFSPGIFIWCGDCFDIFSGRKERPSKAAWKSGMYKFPETIVRPWRLLRIFIYFYYAFRIFIYRISHK